MRKKNLHTIFTIIFSLVFILFSLTCVWAVEPVTGIDRLYEILQTGELPLDSVIGKLIEPDSLSYEYSLSEVIQRVFLSKEGTKKFSRYIDKDTLLMFTVLHGDTLIPMLPADGMVLGRIVLVNETARVPVRLFFQDTSVTGDVFFVERPDGWKILSAVFDFSNDNY